MASAVKDVQLQRALTFEHLIGFGVASIMGSGGFNLIGDAIIAGGRQFPIALGLIAALFQGTSLVYQEAYSEFKTNSSESDIINKELGGIASNVSSVSILLYALISTSVILVICSKLLFPEGSWSGQISFALVLLSGMTAAAMQGIEVDKEIISIAGLSIACLLVFATTIGLVEIGTKGFPVKFPQSLDVKSSLVHSILYFYFVLAGFDILMKFAEESKDPDRDLPRSFYTSNAISTLLTVGICIAFLVVFTTHRFQENENIIAKIVGTMLGENAEQVTGFISIVAVIVTGFVSFLAATRYMFSISISSTNHILEQLRELNTVKAPWKMIAIAAFIIGIGILNNNVFSLVRISDILLTLTLFMVSASVSKMQVVKGKVPWIEGLTTAGLGALLSACIMYR
jgi:APA family basic amino acid/polyamine antiporter